VDAVRIELTFRLFDTPLQSADSPIYPFAPICSDGGDRTHYWQEREKMKNPVTSNAVSIVAISTISRLRLAFDFH